MDTRVTISLERDFTSRRRRVVGHDYSLRMQGLFLLWLFPTSIVGRPFIILFFSFLLYLIVSCPLLTRGRHPVAFRLYLSTACLLVAQALYIKRQGACYRALCRRGGLTVENEASASYADLSSNQYAMSSRRFLPSSPSFDLFLTLLLLFSLHFVRHLSFFHSFICFSVFSFACISLFDRLLSFYCSTIFSRVRLCNGRWLQSCMTLFLKVTRSRQHFVSFPSIAYFCNTVYSFDAIFYSKKVTFQYYFY